MLIKILTITIRCAIKKKSANRLWYFQNVCLYKVINIIAYKFLKRSILFYKILLSLDEISISKDYTIHPNRMCGIAYVGIVHILNETRYIIYLK